MIKNLGMLVLMALALGLAGCQTTPRESDADKPPRIGTPIAYIPAQSVARLQFESGPYATLYDGSSTCVLVSATPIRDIDPEPLPGETPAPASAPQTVSEPIQSELVFQLTLKSVFEDSSIAYDAVGLRGVRAYLHLPDGSQVSPMQTVLDSQLTEQAQGALRSYQRTLSLVFPRTMILLPTPKPGETATGIRLVLEGYGARYFFEWPPVLPGEVRPAPFRESETYENIKEGYGKAKDWTREKVHTFD